MARTNSTPRTQPAGSLGQAPGRPVSVSLSPPAYQVRQQAGLSLPNAAQLAEALVGVLGGAAISAVFITLLPPTNKWAAALLTGSLGALLAATSPIGTIAEEAGMGAFAASASWIYFDLAGQVSPQPPQVTGGSG